ncbi:hypothetical protein [Nocardia bovistercoris]|uniref:Uncharacterized protein n=1 Tax=Nocardia bovistercoris TaxID=2785916 RepID=A0A931IFU1_9NOCA|nr:hypothetical protein [Nocardia bovistercoris]MBH0778908.1 hypothetical protein [Nocardia bovistercoris]
MALDITAELITSDITPEYARYFPTNQGGHWLLSWLPEIPLTREQAINGMVLDETLSDPHLTDTATAMELAAHRARTLGTTLAAVVIRLSIRILEREAPEPPTPIPPPMTPSQPPEPIPTP